MTAIFQLPEPFIQLFPDGSQGPFHFILCRDIMTGRINRHMFSFGNDFSGQHIHFGQSVNFITEHFNADNGIIERRRKDFDGITMNAECPPFQAHIIARILDIDQLMQDFFLGLFLTEAQRNDEFAVIFRVAQAIDAGHGCNDNDVAPFKEAHRSRMAQFIDFIVDRRVFFNICIGRSNIRFRLIVIIVTDKVSHFVIREERLEFTAKLGSQCLVVGNDQRRFLHGFNDLGHGERLARPRGPEQDLRPLTGLYPFSQ